MTRRVQRVFAALGVAAALFGAALLHAEIAGRLDRVRLAETANLVARAGLTDLALFTEARYTRNPAMADLHTAFQDTPMGFEHFPSGSFAPRPAAPWGATTLWFGTEEAPR